MQVNFLTQAACIALIITSLGVLLLHMQPLQIAIEAMFISVDLLPLKK